jgi:hypothetical protein
MGWFFSVSCAVCVVIFRAVGGGFLAFSLSVVGLCVSMRLHAAHLQLTEAAEL